MPGQSLKRGVGRGGAEDAESQKAGAQSRRARLVLDLLGKQGAERLAGHAFLAELVRLAAPDAAMRDRAGAAEISSLVAKLTTMSARDRPAVPHPAGSNAAPIAADARDIAPRIDPAAPHDPAFDPGQVDPLNDHPAVVALTLAVAPRAVAVEILQSLPGRRARLILRQMNCLSAVAPGKGRIPGRPTPAS